MRIFFFALILLSLSAKSFAEEFSEEERLKGFAQHQQRNKEFSAKREAAADAVQKKRDEWEKQRQASVPEYKEWKAKQKQSLDETSPEYFEDLKQKKAQDLKLEEARKAYVKERDAKRAQRKATIKLTEEEEYGLNENPPRVDYRNRKPYGGKPSGRGGSFPSSRSGSIDFGNAPPAHSNEFGTSPPPPPTPEFFEPEIPPPPPPPPPEFEEPVPPPVFDDPDF
jgi:hypothetical protein